MLLGEAILDTWPALPASVSWFAQTKSPYHHQLLPHRGSRKSAQHQKYLLALTPARLNLLFHSAYPLPESLTTPIFKFLLHPLQSAHVFYNARATHPKPEGLCEFKVDFQYGIKKLGRHGCRSRWKWERRHYCHVRLRVLEGESDLRQPRSWLR